MNEHSVVVSFVERCMTCRKNNLNSELVIMYFKSRSLRFLNSIFPIISMEINFTVLLRRDGYSTSVVTLGWHVFAKIAISNVQGSGSSPIRQLEDNHHADCGFERKAMQCSTAELIKLCMLSLTIAPSLYWYSIAFSSLCLCSGHKVEPVCSTIFLLSTTIKWRQLLFPWKRRNFA